MPYKRRYRRRTTNKNKGSTYRRKTKRKSRNKALSGPTDTFIEKVARRQAKLEIDKNKKQKYLVAVMRGFLHAPEFDTSQNGEYTEPFVDNYPTITNIPLYGQDIMVFPKIRTLPKQVQIDLSIPNPAEIEQGNQHICYIDGNEWGYGRTGDNVMIKAFKINVEIEPDKTNTTNNEVQLDLTFFEAPGDDTEGKKTSFAQFIMPTIDQKELCSTRMIRDILGSNGINATNALNNVTPNIGSTIKKLLLKKTWVLKPKQSLKTVGGDYEFIQTNIKQEFYIPINKKLTYARGQALTGGGIRKHTNLTISTQGTQGAGLEKVDSYTNRKYYCMCKSNQPPGPIGKPPKLKVVVTTYFTDIN